VSDEGLRAALADFTALTSLNMTFKKWHVKAVESSEAAQL
jgi:hypothetical protein